MTRKDYVLLAAALKARWPLHMGDPACFRLRTEGYMRAVEEIAQALAQDNPRFDRARFLKACGVEV